MGGEKQTVNYYNINVSRALTATGQEAGYAQLRLSTGALGWRGMESEWVKGEGKVAKYLTNWDY